MAASTSLFRCSKCQLFKMLSSTKFLYHGFFTSPHSTAAFRLPFSRMLTLVFYYKSNLLFRSASHQTPVNSCKMSTLAEIENKPLLKTRLDYFDLLIKLEGLDRTVLDNFCRFVVSASKMMNLQAIKKGKLQVDHLKLILTTEAVTPSQDQNGWSVPMLAAISLNLTPADFKHNQILARPLDSFKKHRATLHLNKTGRISLFFRFNLTEEHFTPTPTQPLEHYKKLRKTYHFNKKGRIIQVGKIPFEKSVIFIKYLQDNVPEGVSFHMELKKMEMFPFPS